MIQNRSNINALKFLSSFVIIFIHTGLFFYTIFHVYNRILAAPLDTGGYLLTALYAVVLTVVFIIMGALRVGYNRKVNIILSHIISLVLVNMFSYLQLSLIHRAFLPVWQMIVLTVINVGISVVWTFIVFALNKRYVPLKNMILVYGDKKAEEIVYKILEREDQYRICESVMYSNKSDLFDDNFEDVKKRILNYDAVVVSHIESSVRNDLLKFCFENDKEVYLPPRISDIIVRGAKDLTQFDSPFIVCKNCSLTEQQQFFKRFFDIFLSLIGIIVASPIMLITALFIKIYDGGPVIFKQKRVTLDERPFDIFKFRSMIVDAEKNDAVIPTIDDDPRVTPVGKIIRKLRIDELPQLFNILIGDMSIVGPRPERVEHHKSYTEQIPEFPFRTKVKAGLTGYAQIMGKYNTSPYDKLRLDLIYIQQFSFFLDLRLILLTIKIVFMKESTEGFKDDKKKEE